jgi:osmotically-inducible protein OsmY
MSVLFDPPPPFEPADVLFASPHTYLRRLSVTTNDMEVVISGRVPSYYLKQMAQEAVRACLGTRRLRNEVQVSTA